MSAVEVLGAALAADVEVRVDGEALILEAAAPPLAGVIDLLSRNKSGLIELLRPRTDVWSAENWQAFFDERTAVAESDGGLSRREAEARAFETYVVEWLNHNGVRSDSHRCCWCGGGEREANVLLPFGVDSTGHAWLHSHCWRPWHRQRQVRAITFLRALGIAAPSDFPNDFAKNGAP